jgi:soluble lytic murein transglycosylase-like protein
MTSPFRRPDGHRVSLLYAAIVAALVCSNALSIIVALRPAPVKPTAVAVPDPPPFWPERKKLESYVLANYNVYPSYVSYVFDAVESNAKKYKLPPVFLLSVISVESSFDFGAVSNKQCKGMMQINYPMWALELKAAGIATSEKQLYDPKVNIEAGSYVLAKLLKQWSDPELVLSKYLGCNNKDYSNKVLNTWGEYSLICTLN